MPLPQASGNKISDEFNAEAELDRALHASIDASAAKLKQDEEEKLRKIEERSKARMMAPPPVKAAPALRAPGGLASGSAEAWTPSLPPFKAVPVGKPPPPGAGGPKVPKLGNWGDGIPEKARPEAKGTHVGDGALPSGSARPPVHSSHLSAAVLNDTIRNPFYGGVVCAA